MRHEQEVVEISSRGAGLYEFTGAAQRFVRQSAIGMGLATFFCRHTSASLLIQENADPDVQTDLQHFFERLVPEGESWVVHTTEGPDDMPAHIKTALTQTSINVPISDGRLVLGTWQGLYLFEHRRHPNLRQVVMHVMGD